MRRYRALSQGVFPAPDLGPSYLAASRPAETGLHPRKLPNDEPLRAPAGFNTWISGRKSFQSVGRRDLPPIEREGAHAKINPLANWSKAALDAYFTRHDLPRYPLEADGFLSIGCMPCTDRVAPGEDSRAGRWRGAAKTECGIHRERWQPRDSQT